MKVLLLGAKGMAGHIISRRLKDAHHTVYGTSRYAGAYSDPNIIPFDAVDERTWLPTLDAFAVDVVINCIGMLVKACEDFPVKALRVNANFPKFLESYYRHSDTQVVHISTDCVFNGKRGEYTLLDAPNETHVYGRTKALGEIDNHKDLTIRTSIIGLELGSKPNSSCNSGLMHWFLNQPRGSRIQGFSECYWSGISTLELADAIEWYLDNPSHGIHQVSRALKISKFELLSKANTIFDRSLDIQKSSRKHVDKSLTPSEEAFQISASYSEMLKRMRCTLSDQYHTPKDPSSSFNT